MDLHANTLATVTAGSKTIVFAMLHESGHLNPSFKLARSLARRGHDVAYLAIPEANEAIAVQGFRTLALYPDLFPRGFAQREQHMSTLARRRAITRRFAAMLARLAARPDGLLPARPDLMLIDITRPELAFWARRAGQPFLYLNTSLPQTHDRGVPPLRSAHAHGPGIVPVLKAELEWTKFLIKRRASAAAASLAGLCPPYELARRAAARFDVPSRELDWRTAYMPQLRGVRELVFCPDAFDFPRPTDLRRVSIASVDLARREASFDLDAVSHDRPLVYCAFGGQRYRADDVPGFFARLVEAMRARPAFHLLLAMGKHVAPPSLGSLPANVTLVETAPQLAVLERARAMITHAGLGSVKECIMLGVPMLAVPLDIDQPANAARIIYHGLGTQADVAACTPGELAGKLDLLLRDRATRERVSAMRARFLEVEDTERGSELVEDALARCAR